MLRDDAAATKEGRRDGRAGGGGVIEGEPKERDRFDEGGTSSIYLPSILRGRCLSSSSEDASRTNSTGRDDPFPVAAGMRNDGGTVKNGGDK